MILLISPAGTPGWRAVEAALSDSLDRLGVPHQVRRVELGRLGRLRRIWALGAPLVAWYSLRELRRALRQGADPEAVIAVNGSSSMLLPFRRLHDRGVPVAVRIDSPAAEVWRGPSHGLHRRLENRALRRADLVLTSGSRSTEAARPLASRIAEVPFGLEPQPPEDPAAPPIVLAYAANPEQKGLDLICRAWGELESRPVGATLTVAGIEPERGRAFLARRGAPEPEGLRWTGLLPRGEYLELLAKSAAFVSASRWEDHGLAQLEALAAGVPLVTTDSRGAYEAGPIARELAPELFCEAEPGALAQAIATALEMTAERRAGYARLAAEALAAYGTDRADGALAAALNSLGIETAAPAPAGARTPPRSAG